MDINKIKDQAVKELKEEQFRKAVDEMKLKIKSKKWWHNILPFKIVIIRRENGNCK